MSDTTQTYNAAVAIVCQLAPSGVGLASSLITGREGAAFNVAGAAKPPLDGTIELSIKMGAAAPTGDIHVGLTTMEDGTNWGAPATGLDAPLTLPRAFDTSEMVQSPNGIWYIPGTGIIYLGKMECYGRAALAVVERPFPGIALACGGTLPKQLSLFILNQTGQALDTTEGNHRKQFIGKYVSTA